MCRAPFYGKGDSPRAKACGKKTLIAAYKRSIVRRGNLRQQTNYTLLQLKEEEDRTSCYLKGLLLRLLYNITDSCTTLLKPHDTSIHGNTVALGLLTGLFLTYNNVYSQSAVQVSFTAELLPCYFCTQPAELLCQSSRHRV